MTDNLGQNKCCTNPNMQSVYYAISDSCQSHSSNRRNIVHSLANYTLIFISLFCFKLSVIDNNEFVTVTYFQCDVWHVDSSD